MKPSLKRPARAGVVGGIGDRVDQQLHRGHRAAAVARHVADDRRHVAAGRVATDADPLRVGAERLGVRDRPLEGGEGVFDRRRERVLRRQPVADREDPAAGRRGEEPAHPVVHVEVADHPAAAVVVDEQRGRGRGRRNAGGRRGARGAVRRVRGRRRRAPRPSGSAAAGTRRGPRSGTAPAPPRRFSRRRSRCCRTTAPGSAARASRSTASGRRPSAACRRAPGSSAAKVRRPI